MTDTITLTGIVGSDPRHHVTNQGLAITSFRFASRHRYFDRTKGAWEDGETNWYTVSAFRQLAVNTSLSVRKGERLVVRGRLRQREWNNGTKAGTNVEIEADTIGHDLSWCVTTYGRLEKPRAAGTEADAAETEVAADGSSIGFGAPDDAAGWGVSDLGGSDPDHAFTAYDDADERTGEVFATAGAAD
ncbi:single-stranded DNA-binding protein [Agromyces neolithicus]